MKKSFDNHGSINQHDAQYTNKDNQFNGVVENDIVFFCSGFPQKYKEEEKDNTHKIKVVFHHSNLRVFPKKIDRIHCKEY